MRKWGNLGIKDLIGVFLTFRGFVLTGDSEELSDYEGDEAGAAADLFTEVRREWKGRA